MRRFSTFVSLVGLSLVAACSSDKVTSPVTPPPVVPPAQTAQDTVTAQAQTDVTPSAAVDASQDVALMTQSYSGVSFNRLSGNLVVARTDAVHPAASCSFEGTALRWVCHIETPFMTRTVSVGFLDPTGKAAQGLVPGVTTQIVMAVSDTGHHSFAVQGDTVTDSVASAHTRTITSLGHLGDSTDTVRVWNGNGTSHHRSIRTGKHARDFSTSAVDSMIDVHVRHFAHDSAGVYPLSGTLVKHLTVTRTRDGADTSSVTVTLTMTLTFNGTHLVPVTVTSSAGKTDYILDLDTGDLSKP